MTKTYQKIEEVLTLAGRPLAPHEFELVDVRAQHENPLGYRILDGRQYVGCSESALGRRLREMRQMKMVTSQRREGTAYVEYSLVVKPVAQEMEALP